MIKDRNIDPFANIDPSKILGGGFAMTPVAKTYYVDRNVGVSGDGEAFDRAFLTIGEAVAAANADYTAGANNPRSRGRMRRIIVAEGWYSEVPLTLTAGDCHIIGVGPGGGDASVLYGSATAGGYDSSAGGPALKVTGSNVTIEHLGMFTYDNSYASLQLGALSGAVYSCKVLNCNFTRDQADGAVGGILCYDLDDTSIIGNFFSTSCKDYGLWSKTDGVNNPVNTVIWGNRFVGTPIGIEVGGHNALCMWNMFYDDTSDRADTCDYPIVVDGSAICWRNFSQGTTAAELVTGSGTILDIGNFGSDS